MKRSFADALEENGDENMNKKSRKNEDDDSIDKTTNNKKEEDEIYSYDECDDVMVLEDGDGESNKKTSCFDHQDWTIDITDSYKPCELCLRDGPEE